MKALQSTYFQLQANSTVRIVFHEPGAEFWMYMDWWPHEPASKVFDSKTVIKDVILRKNVFTKHHHCINYIEHEYFSKL